MGSETFRTLSWGHRLALMNKKKRWRWFAAAAAVAIAAVPVGRALLSAEAKTALETAAERRGLELKWRSLELGFDATVRLEGVTAQGPQGSIEVESMTAAFDVWALLRGSRTPESVHIEGAAAAIDLSERPSTRDVSARATAPVEPPEMALKVTRSRASIAGLGRGLGPIVLDEIEMETTPGSPPFSAQVIARCASGCFGAQRLDALVKAQPQGRSVSVSLSPAATLEVPFEGQQVTVSVPQAGLTQTGEGLVLEARQISASLLLEGHPVELAIERVSAPLPEDLEGAFFEVERPTITLVDGPPAEPAEPADRASRRLSGADLAAMRAGFAALRDRALSVSRRVRVTGGALEVGDERVEEINLARRGGRLKVSGRWRGQWEVTLEAGSLRLGASFKGFDVSPLASRLGLPGVKEAGALVTGDVVLDLDAALKDKRAQPRQGVSIAAAVKLSEARFHLPALTATPIVSPSAELVLDASYAPALDRPRRPDHFNVERLRLTLPSRDPEAPATLIATGSLIGMRGRKAPIIEAEVSLEETECQHALDAIPRALNPSIKGKISARGRFSPSLSMRVDVKDPETLRLRVRGLPGTCRIESLGDKDPSRLGQTFRQEVREGVSKRGVFVGPGAQGYVKLQAMPAYVGAAAYLSEEARFRTNPGFDLGLMRRAIRTNIKGGRYVYGGSSVSQQLVKNLFLTRDKTLGRKLEEAIIVWRMEDALSKDRILELYLNCIEYGPDLYGIGPAALRYFKRPATKLTPLQASLLAAIKPAPWYGERFFERRRTPKSGWWQTRLQFIMERLHEKGFISEEALASADPYVVYFPR